MHPSPASSQHQDEPVTGWKLAFLVKDARNISFRALTRHIRYPAGPQRFSCDCPDPGFPPVLCPPHPKPALGGDASCGWYAMKNKQDCLDAYRTRLARNPYEMNAWLLEVDLWGTVIEAERGYRGEYQRVLSVQPAGSPDRGDPHREQLYLMGPQILYRQLNRGMTPPMKPVLSVPDLAARLGTEVLWPDRAADQATAAGSGRFRLLERLGGHRPRDQR